VQNFCKIVKLGRERPSRKWGRFNVTKYLKEVGLGNAKFAELT
jgi:hypothetical protein